MKRFDKKVFFTLLSSVTMSGFIVICTLSQSLSFRKAEAKAERSVKELPEPVCIVREYNGKIGVFRGGSETPYMVVDFDTSLLSEADREDIGNGIVMESSEELRHFIEDISS